MALSHDVYVYILYDHPGISVSIPYRDLAGIVQKTHSHRVIFTNSAQKSHDAHAMVLLVPYDYREPAIIFYPNDYLIVVSSRSVCGTRFGIVRSTDVSIIGVQACDFLKFVIVQSQTKS